MDRFFSNYRINKNVERTGVNLLMKNIRTKTRTSSVVVFTALKKTQEQLQENWFIKKYKNGKYEYVCPDKRVTALKSSILNSLSDADTIVVVLVCDMKQKIDKKKSIKEMWGFRLLNNGKTTSLEEISSEEIYTYSTTNINTGKSIPPAKEIVYCGPDGKICGWDMI